MKNKMTIENIPDYLLAEHMGSCATTEEARRFRALACKRGYSDARVCDISDDVWFSLIQEVSS